MDALTETVEAMASARTGLAVQRSQTLFRMKMVEKWRIPTGATVLEIGCGQGDMTAVLAQAVGRNGRVVALDVAGPDYGSPVTLGESADFLMSSSLGKRIEMRFETDVLDSRTTFPSDSFDYVVLSQSSWYFASADQFADTLARVRPWAHRLCFSEWDLRPTDSAQIPHLLAVLAQGQIEAGGARGNGNVRTPTSREAALRILARTGWQVRDEHHVATTDLQDADWEIDACLRMVDDAERMGRLNAATREFVTSQADVLRTLAKERGNSPLGTYALVAERMRD
ncbi:methyltransferase type 11 [Streptomyces sp. 150FB]|uniref:class I SAM-dependent methyltransferase n=1 Tax=Streptomyces sp. 150FB TaxID=1576605 RepID=UPI000589693E|nr:class I SAM-dependent methyltransferase [Streptomyces sp. 150FB]KIF72892.1 methyltransferase type 11 [Streptomyces sp. 150FB]